MNEKYANGGVIILRSSIISEEEHKDGVHKISRSVRIHNSFPSTVLNDDSLEDSSVELSEISSVVNSRLQINDRGVI